MENNIETLVVSEIEKSSIEVQTKELIKTKFLPIIEQLNGWEEKAMSLVVTDSNQTDLMKQAREGRLHLKNVRVSADKLRKDLKQDSQTYLNTIQWVYNFIEGRISPLEDHLEKQEKFIELENERIKKQLEHDRSLKLVGLESFVPFVVHSQLGLMSENDFENVYQSAVLLKSQKEQEEDRKRIEAERLKAEAEERERILEASRLEQILEAERLKEEQDKLEEKLRLAREENERIALELKKKQDEEAKAEKERLKAEKKLKNAPDKLKLEKFISDIEQTQFPQMQTEDGELIVKNIKDLFSKIIIFAKEKSNNL